MTDRLTCHDCGRRIPNGHAHIRTRVFVQVATHGYCWTMRKLAAAFRPAA
jgi:hypothetical protein